jgi:hypothetical protein
VAIEPERGFDVGGGPGKRVEREVRGGTVGLALDARGRPLQLPEDRKEGRAMMTKWVQAMAMYPEQS